MRRMNKLVPAALLLLCPPLGAATWASTPKEAPSSGATVVESVERVASPIVMVNYRLKPGAAPLTGVDLYVTLDRGDSWSKAVLTGPIESPIRFTARRDGLHGLFLVFHTAEGSTAAPSKGTPAQRWVLVDTTAPLIALRGLRPDQHFYLSREVEISWRVEDSDLINRPVTLSFRSEQSKLYKTVAESQPATGSVRWAVPEGVFGRIDLKISAVDRAGNRAEYIDDRLRVSDEEAELSALRSSNDTDAGFFAGVTTDDSGSESSRDNSQTPELQGPAFESEPDQGESVLDTRAAKEAKKQYDLATWHRLRGENEIALSKYREAVRLLPEYHAARNDLAALLCQLRAYDDAETEYLAVLKSDSKHRSALKGLAWVQARKRNYRSAHGTLEKLLLLDPQDAEAWLNFGDVRLFMGDRSAAREAWIKSAAIDAASKEIRGRAEKRLEMYQDEGGSRQGVVKTSSETGS